MKIFVTGGTGLVGTRLVRRLLEQGDKVVVLTRRYAVAQKTLTNNVELVEGDPCQEGEWMQKIAECDGVIHLAGENVFAKRWTTSFKQSLVDSRVKSTRLIAQALSRKPLRGSGLPKVLISASAIGIYGARGAEEITEKTEPGTGFLADLCINWEKEARAVEAHGVRAAQIRVGVVLDKEGGALANLLPPFRMFAGGPVGSGKQYMSWIHHDDLVNLFLFALDNDRVRGPLNGTAPNPVTNADFGKALGKVLGRPSFVWTPGFALKLLLGEVADVITSGQRVLPAKPLSLDFSFKFPTIDVALADILKK